MLARQTRTSILALAAFALSGTIALAQPAPAAPAPATAPAPAAAPIERQPPSDDMRPGMHPGMRRPGMRPGGMRPNEMQDHRNGPGNFRSHQTQGRGDFHGGPRGNFSDGGRGGEFHGPQGGRGGDFHGGPGGEGFRGGPQGGMWWKSPMITQRLGLTPDQVKRMDGIFQQSRLQLIDLKANVEKQEVLLEPLLSANPPDIARATVQIDKVADARADLEKSNAKMLLGIRGVLTPEQWTKLHDHHGFGGPAGPDGAPTPPAAPAPAGRTRGLRPSGPAASTTHNAVAPPDQQ